LKTINHLFNKVILIFFIAITPLILQAETVDPYKNIKFITLENGLKVYLLSDQKSINTEVSLTVNVGRESETKENAGITHLVEHLVFRDKRIPHRDYLDYIEEEGASYVNGYTKRYTTEYVATIKSDKTEWLIETFAQMIFDKEIDEKDLEIEKKALQVEIGKLQWTDYLERVGKSIIKIYPEREDFYFSEFGLKKIEPRHASYYYKNNNYTFKLDELLKYYNEYYYPKNMTLEVAGNFDMKEIEALIVKKYGSIKKEGTKTTKEPEEKGTLNNQPYLNYETDNDENTAYIGTKYIVENYKKYLILDAYTEFLSTRMQQLLRNKLGQTYSVNSFHYKRQNSAITGIVFEDMHETFQESIQLVKEQIQKDKIKISEKEITEALKKYALYYSSLEHSSQTLLELIGTQKYLHKTYKTFNKTPFEIFNSITAEEFQKTVSESFVDKNQYLAIYNDYYFFSYESIVLLVLLIALFIYIFKTVMLTYYKKQGKVIYTKREILFSRKLTPLFISIIGFIFISIIALSIAAWCEFLLYDLIMGNPYYLSSVKLPYSIFLEIASFLFYIMIFLLIKTFVFSKSYARLDVTKNVLNLLGGQWLEIKKEDILSTEIAPWSLNKTKNIKGKSLLFWKPLVQVITKDDQEIYLRTENAEHLKEDLDAWLEKE